MRISIGFIMALHGLDKHKGCEFYEERWKTKYGFPRGSVIVNVVVQFFGSLIIMAGIFTQVVSFILILDMIVATWVRITKNKESFLTLPRVKGWDYNFLILIGLFALVCFGDGSFSLAGLLSYTV